LETEDVERRGVMTSPKDVKFNTDDVVVYLAAAGAGKTTAIMDEMTELLKTYRPDEIAFVTFTRKGVINGMERALRANPRLTADDLVYFRTLHALCFRELGLGCESIITRPDIEEFNKASNYEFNAALTGAFEHQTEDDRLLARYDALRNGARKGVVADYTHDTERYTRLTKAYEAFKSARGKVDFHDCLVKFCERNKPVGVKIAFIDEAQDLTPLQWEVCRIAFSAAEKVRIAGDDFQSLFTYSGASPAAFISLSERYNEVRLEKPYRIPKAVYRFTKGVTQLITKKVDKDYAPAKDVEGFVEEISDRNVLVHRIQKDMDDNGITPYRWYLLFRNNCFIEETVSLLEKHQVPYHTANGFCISKEHLVRIRRFYNYRTQYTRSKETFLKFCDDYDIKDINDDFTESGLVPVGRRYVCFAYVQAFGVDKLIEMADREPFLLLSTTHRVKGGEADYAAVFLDCTRRVAENIQLNMDEELRVLYVACTRAKLGLYLVSGTGEYGLDKVIGAVKDCIE
jgi:superfamily I DNA/RNA helicase